MSVDKQNTMPWSSEMSRYLGLIRLLRRVATHKLKPQDGVINLDRKIVETKLSDTGRPCLHRAYPNFPSILHHVHGMPSHAPNGHDGWKCNWTYAQARSLQTTCASGVATSSQNNWLPEMEELYSRLRAQADREGWVQLRNTSTDPGPAKPLFSRIATENGPVIHTAFFLQKDERKLMGVCQFGEEAQGPPGLVHGGASATIHDAITGVLTHHVHGKICVTASLTVNFKRPTPLRCTLLMEANIDKIVGTKIFVQSRFKSPDGATLYSDCSALYIDVEDRVRAAAAKSNSPE